VNTKVGGNPPYVIKGEPKVRASRSLGPGWTQHLVKKRKRKKKKQVEEEKRRKEGRLKQNQPCRRDLLNDKVGPELCQRNSGQTNHLGDDTNDHSLTGIWCWVVRGIGKKKKPEKQESHSLGKTRKDDKREDVDEKAVEGWTQKKSSSKIDLVLNH